jgi:RHS repeat-associated protein
MIKQQIQLFSSQLFRMIKAASYLTLILIVFSTTRSQSQCLNQYSISPPSGNLCNGSRSVTITMYYSNQLNVTYELLKDGGISGYPSQIGTGNGLLTWTVTSGVGTYTIRAKMGTCTQVMTGTTVITNQQVPIATITPSGSGCSTILTGGGGTSYAWRLNDPNGTVIASTQTLQPKKSGTFYLTVTNDCGYTNQTSYNLLTITKVAPSPNGSPVNTCPGILTLNPSGGTNYQWTLPNGSTQAGGSLLVNVPGTYSLTGTNTCNVSETNSLAITMQPVIQTPPVAVGMKISFNGTATLSATGAGSNESYMWYDASNIWLKNATTYTTSNLIANTSYYVAKYSTSGIACPSGKSQPINVIVNKIPIANAGASKTIILPTKNTYLSGTASDPDNDPLTYSWLISCGGCTNSGNTNLTFSVSNLSTGSYVAQLNVFDGFDTATDTAKIILNEPPNNFNWIKETTVLVKNMTTTDNVNALAITTGEKNVSMEYYDGIGRPVQAVSVQGSPLGNDIAVPTVYDAFGRKNRKYLPVAVNEANGYYKNNKIIIDPNTGNYTGALAGGFYLAGSNNGVADDSRPFSETNFELSAVSRPDKIFEPGEAWGPQSGGNNKFTKVQRLSNIHGTSANLIEEKVVLWTISATTKLPVRSGFYNSGLLNITSVIDEQGHEIREYKNISGQTILKKVQVVENTTSLNDNTQWALTYYLYDDFGNLRYVLQPVLSSYVLGNDSYTITPADLNKLAFQYRYDLKQRMIIKKNPGADSVYMVYDKYNRLVFTQDGNQRKDASGNITKKDWMFIKYDALNRPVMSGIYTHTAVLDQPRMAILTNTLDRSESYNGPASANGYTNNTFPIGTFPASNFKVLSVTYYDNYSFVADLFGDNYKYTPNDLVDQEVSENTKVRGMSTGAKINILGTSDFSLNVTYYDKKYRIIQAKNLNLKSGIDRVTNVYDFVKLLTSKSSHINGANTYTQERKYTYDHMLRPLQIFHKIQTEPLTEQFILLTKNKYNEIGQLITERLHSRDNGLSFAQNTDYAYNIRGWMNKINDVTGIEASDLFSMDLRYNAPSSNGGPQQYGGNISEIIWKTCGQDKQSYGYKYDAMNRLLEANYFNVIRPLNNGRYTEKIGDYNSFPVRPSYDLNGNILNLIRYGKKDALSYEKIDDLNYVYSGLDNSLTKINEYKVDSNFDDGFKGSSIDSPNEYAYDWNGNTKTDINKGITVTYNHLNLPVTVSKGSDVVSYTYDATGKKLSQQLSGAISKTTDYLGDYVYENNLLQLVQHEKGRILQDNTVGAPHRWEYQYFLKDHLGNVRVVFSEKTNSIEFMATMEKTPASVDSDENAKFLNMKSALKVNQHNHTPGKASSYRLSGSPGEVIGPARSFPVNPGDAFDVEAFVTYESETSSGSDIGNFMTSLINAFALQSTGGTGVDGSQAYNKFSSLFTSPWITSSSYEDISAPKAFLNYLLFDENFNWIDAGFDQVNVAGATSHDYLSLNVKVKQKGYLYIYLSNENNKIIPLFFDDFRIVQRSNINQISEFYAFGLKQQSNSSENSTIKNMHLYNGKELQDELNLGWMDYGWRNYDPTIGRFGVIDNFADNYFDLTPYQYGSNNPIKYVDVNGDSLMLFKNGVYVGMHDDGSEEITGYNQTSTTDKNGNETFTGAQCFSINDIGLDEDKIKSGKMKLNFISDKDVKGIIKKSGVENQNVFSRWTYAANQSNSNDDDGGDKMDFLGYEELSFSGLNIINGVGYNMNDAGNYLWGYAMGRMGFSSIGARGIAHVYSWWRAKQDNKGMTSTATNPLKRWYENRSWGGDSEADQRAIQNGLNDSGGYGEAKWKSIKKLWE